MRTNIFLLAIVITFLSSCAPAPTVPASDLDRELTLGEPLDTVCFSSGLSGFRELGEDKLLVRRGPQDAYILSVGFCPNLKSAEGLRITDPAQCLKRGSRIEVYDTALPQKNAASDRPDECLVTQIHRANSMPRNR